MSQTRLALLRATMAERNLPAMLISNAANRRYLSGFTGSSGTLFITPDHALLFTDGRYTIQAAREAPAFTLYETASPERSMHTLLIEVLSELAVDLVGFEAAHVSVAEHYALSKALFDTPVELEPVDGLVEALREVKDAAEVATLRRAVEVTDAAFLAVLPHLRPDMTERQAAWMLEVAMRERGAEGLAFPIIVAAGLNSALPHANPGDAPLGESCPIVIDMGARVDGYHADMTRTITLGSPDATFQTIYAIVLEAQQRAIAALRAGLRCNAADSIARDHITATGYPDAFRHSLGHGVGLDIHEGPALRRAKPGFEQNGPRLQVGNVVSIEPGIYLDDWGGVRIEDLALITEDGCEVLSQVPR